MRFRCWVAFLTLLFCLIVSTSVSRAGSNTWTGGTPSGAAASFENPTLVATSGSDPYLVYAAYDSDLYRSADGGRTWALLASFESITALEVNRAAPSTLYLGARARPDTFAGVFKSDDGGVTWNQTLNHADHIVVKGFATSLENLSSVYAFTSGRHFHPSKVFKSSDGGLNWAEMDAPPSSNSRLAESVAALIIDPKTPTTVYAIGSDVDYYYGSYYYPFFRRTDDGGLTWTDQSMGLGGGAAQTATVDPIDPSRIMIGGTGHAGASVYRTLDGGASWTPAQRGLPAGTEVSSLAGDPHDPRIVYAGTKSGVFRTRDGGESWVSIGQKLNRVLMGNLALGANGQLHAGTQYGAFDLEIDEGSVDVASESGQTRLLSWINDRMSVRTLPAAGEPIQTPQEGPFGAWTATAISDGPDGRSRVLWVNGDGRAGLGIVGSAGSEAAFQFPATPQWSATDVATSRDGSASVLWTRASGAMYLATVDTSGVATLGPKYGPYAGWSPIAIAEGLDGSTWVLWRSTDGRVSVARHRARVLDGAFRLDANPDWPAEDIAVAADGRPRLLRVHRDGRASLATLDAAGRLTAEQVHADGGLIPRRISAGPDGETRLLWRSAGGSEKVWLLNLDNSRKAAPTPTPTPTPPPAGPLGPSIGDLNGTWTGSFRGPGSNTQIRARVQHTGNHVTVSFDAPGGGWEFGGTLRGGLRGGLFASGSLDCCLPLRQGVGQLTGEVFARSIALDGGAYHISLSR